MLRAVIFDFNGVIVNDEPIHFDIFKNILLEEGIILAAESYYSNYLGMDDRGCFKAVYRNINKNLSESKLQEMVYRKARYYRSFIQEKLVIFPGVKLLITNLSCHFPLGIASGALRGEIEVVLAKFDIKNYFQVIVGAEDITKGKPNPEIFRKVLRRLNQKSRNNMIDPSECLVIEDSKEGIDGAHQAGMKCLAISNSYPANELHQADAVINSLVEVDVEILKGLFLTG